MSDPIYEIGLDTDNESEVLIIDRESRVIILRGGKMGLPKIQKMVERANATQCRLKRALVATVTNSQQKPDAQPTKASTTNMNIGQVIEALKQGKHARRAGWNGKRMHIYMEEGKQRMVGSAMQRTEEPYLVLFTAAQTHQPGWNASTPDLLSDDWEILEAHETDYPRQ